MKGFFKEFQLIHWPTKKEVWKYFRLCFVGMCILGIYISCIDVGTQFTLAKLLSLFS